MRRKDFFFVAALAFLVLAILAPAWFRPHQAIANFGEIYAYHYPLRHLVSSTLEAGRMPFWNPYIFSGLPLAGNSQSVLFYPVSLLGRIFPLILAISWEYAFHLFWAGLGVFFLARRAALSPLGCLLLALLYAFSPFLIYRITAGIPTLLAALSWAPWCWLAWLSLSPGLLAAGWALQLFSGHAQFMVLNALGMGLWAAWHKRPRALAILGREGLGALLLTAVYWAPVREFLANSIRVDWPALYTTAYSFEPATFWTWILPDAWGNPLDKTYRMPPSVFFETSGVFIGLSGFILSLIGLRRKPAALLLIGAGIFLALGGHNPLYPFLLKYSPLGFFRTPARYLFLCLFGLVIAAGAGWRILEMARGARPARYLIFLAVLIELVVWDKRFLRAENSDYYLKTQPSLARQISAKPFRVLTDPEFANPNKTLLYRAMNVNGFEAFFLGAYAQYAARSEGRPAVDPSRSYLQSADSLQMRQLGVAYKITARGLSRASAPYGLSYFTQASGVLPEAGPKVSLERPEAWRITGRWPAQAGQLIVAQPYYPGWHAWVNGLYVPLERWDGFLQAVSAPKALSPGQEFELNLKFTPTGWTFWSLLSLLSWAAWLALWGRKLLAA